MAASRNDGIQLLLQAEKAASEKLHEAKRRKNLRLKQAKAEALVEIDAERAKYEQMFKSRQDQMLGHKLEVQDEITSQTDASIRRQSEQFVAHKESAIQLLLDCVMQIQPEMHRNFKSGAAF